MEHIFKRLVLAFMALFVAFSTGIALAQEDGEPALQIDLEALEGLSPGRQEKDDAPSDVPLPPAEAEKRREAAPEVVSTPGALLEAAPQSPAAPRPTVVSTAPAGKRTAAALRDLIIPILFQPGTDRLSLKASTELDNVINLVLNKGVRLQLMAYAGTSENSESSMRRLALKRAIAIRGHLMSGGVAGTRVDIRPQDVATDSPKERVDIIFLPQ